MFAHSAFEREVRSLQGAITHDLSFGERRSNQWKARERPERMAKLIKTMTAYMPKVGKYGLDMMYRTCTVHTNLDYSGEADMVKKLRVSLALQPVATAIFANSPFTEGKPNGFLSFRSEPLAIGDRCFRARS